jgi:hypothetical protein
VILSCFTNSSGRIGYEARSLSSCFIHASTNSHGEVRSKRYHAVSVFKYTSGIVALVTRSTIGYFKSVVGVSFRLPVTARSSRVKGLTMDGPRPNHLALNQKGPRQDLTHAGHHQAPARFTNQSRRTLLRRPRTWQADRHFLDWAFRRRCWSLMVCLGLVCQRAKHQIKLAKLGASGGTVRTPEGTSALTIGMWPMAASRITLHRLTNQASEWRHLSARRTVPPL